MSYLDPAILSKIGRLDLKAKYVVEGFISGLHRSPFKGFSVEFAQHRGYVPGDDLKHLDWRVYGKSERYYIKQYEAETNLTCHVLLDGSTSMLYQGTRAAAGLSKLEYGKVSAAALSHLVLSQSDAAGLTMFDGDLATVVAPSTRKAHLLRLCAVLEEHEPKNKTAIGEVLHTIGDRVRRRGVVMVISDLLDQPKDILDGMLRLRHQGHEVVALHLMDDDELDFPFEGNIQFKGLEGGRELRVHPRSVKQSYLDELHKHMTALESGCRKCGVDYVLLRTSQPPDVGLAAYLGMRERLRTGVRR